MTTKNKKLNILIYDAKCIFCCTFVKYLNFFADNSKQHFPPIYVISPNDIEKIKYLNEDFYNKLDIKKIKKLSSSTIIFLKKDQVLIRINALIKLANFLRPESYLLFLINKYFNYLFSLVLDPFYIIFSKNRYFFSKILKIIAKFLFLNKNSSCLISTARIKFL